MKKLSLVFVAALMTLMPLAHAQSIIGKWKTIDDETGKARSVVEVFRKGNVYEGRILEIFPSPGDDPNPRCTACNKKDARYNKPINGMVIITGMKRKGNEYEGGKILDPNNGREYSCRMWIENGNLVVRGFVGISLAGRSQTWLPYRD